MCEYQDMYPYYAFVMDGLTYIKDFLVSSGFWSQPLVDVQRASAQLAIPTENKLQTSKYRLHKAFAKNKHPRLSSAFSV